MLRMSDTSSKFEMFVNDNLIICIINRRGDQILEVNGLSLVGIAIENVDKIFKRIKPGKVPLKLMRPANLTAVISELDKLCDDNKSLQPVTSPLVNSYKENENIEVWPSCKLCVCTIRGFYLV